MIAWLISCLYAYTCIHSISIDSHHKLIRWRIVTQGGIDGYSRLIVYLECSSNNRAETVYNLFLNAVHNYELPSRVRADQGLENIMVARHMIETRGAERHSMITGSSTHNQRIERLWRDMHRSTTILYYRLFYFMEQQGILDPLNEHHLWALHYIYLPRLSRALKAFVQSWNNHPMRTTHHNSPLQLFNAGLLLLQNSQLLAMDFFHNVDGTYGIDYDGPVATNNGDTNVVVPQSTLQFSHSDIASLRQMVDPLAVSEDHGIDLYEQTLHYISSFDAV